VSFKLFGCEFPENGELPKHVAVTQDETYISIMCVFVGTERL